jgi:phage terminase Nu1 subunit (DNA packaging protein)
MIVTSTEVLGLFRISREQLRRWREKGCPQISRGRFDLGAVIKWRDETLLSSDKMTAAKLEREQAKAKLATLQAKEKEGSLILKNEAVKWVSILVAEAKQGFMNLPRRFGPVLAVVNDEKEIEELLRKEIWAILRQLAAGGKKGSGKKGT